MRGRDGVTAKKKQSGRGVKMKKEKLKDRNGGKRIPRGGKGVGRR